MNMTYGFRGVVVALILMASVCSISGCSDDTASTAPTPAPTTYSPRFGFEVNRGDDTLSVYLINAATGQWLHHGYVLTGDTPVAVAVTPNENYVYVLNQVDETVSGFTLDADSGRLSLIDPTIATGAGPTAIAVSRDGAFVYVANATDGTLSGYRISSTSGVLSPVTGSPFTVGTGPTAIVLNPVLTHLYVANSGGDSVAAYSINTTGELLALAGSPYTTGVGTVPRELAVDPQGRFVYVANESDDTVAVFAVDAVTGVLTRVDQDAVTVGIQNKPAGDTPNGITVHQGGTFLYVSNAGDDTLSAYTVDTVTGLLTSTGAPLATAADPRGLRADPSGNYLFLASEFGRTLGGYRVNSANGTLTALGITRTRAQPAALTFSQALGALAPQAAQVYAVNAANSELRVYSVNSSTGALSWQSSGITGNSPGSVAVDPFGRFAYVVNTVDDSLRGYGINATNGALTVIDMTPGSIGNDLALGDDPQQVAVDPSGRFVYVSHTTAGVNGEVRAFSIDASNGRLTAIGVLPFATGATPTYLSTDPTGQYLYVVNNNNGGAGSVSMFSIDRDDGALVSLGAAVAAGGSPQAIAIDPTARFAYVTNSSGNTLTRYDLALDGTLTSSGSTTTQTGPLPLAADPLARFLYVGAATTFIEGFSLDAGSGALTSLGTTSLTPAPTSMTPDPSGRFLYVGYSNDPIISVFTVGSTGSLTAADDATDNVGFAQSLALRWKVVSSGSTGNLWE